MNTESKNIKRQSGSIWIDKNNMSVESKRVTQLEKLREAEVTKIVKSALKAEELLKLTKELVTTGAEKCYKAYLMENGEDFIEMQTHTFYNFNESFKVVQEVVNEISFDENRMTLANKQFQEFINESLTKDHQFIKDLVMSAFETKSGKFDYKKINTLISYRNNPSVKDNEAYQKAADTLEEAKFVKGTKSYSRIYIKEKDAYRQIQLQFSAIEV